MQAWKRLLIVAPAGLILGMFGSQLARPVMAQRATNEPWQSVLGVRRDVDHQSSDYPELPGSDLAHVGGYSFPPDMGATNADWPQLPEDRSSYADAPLPTVAQLDARQAALLADPDVQFAVHPPTEESPPAETSRTEANDDAQTATAFGPEPSTPDGQLPAIW